MCLPISNNQMIGRHVWTISGGSQSWLIALGQDCQTPKCWLRQISCLLNCHVLSDWLVPHPASELIGILSVRWSPAAVQNVEVTVTFSSLVMFLPSNPWGFLLPPPATTFFPFFLLPFQKLDQMVFNDKGWIRASDSKIGSASETG